MGKILLVWLLGISLVGCAGMKECAKGIAGTSTKILEEERPNAITKVVRQDYFACYNNILRTLKDIGAYVYDQDLKKDMIAFYVSEEDTTPVGIFFKHLDANNTQVEVISPSTSAKELIAEKIFAVLDKKY